VGPPPPGAWALTEASPVDVERAAAAPDALVASAKGEAVRLGACLRNCESGKFVGRDARGVQGGLRTGYRSQGCRSSATPRSVSVLVWDHQPRGSTSTFLVLATGLAAPSDDALTRLLRARLDELLDRP
jgi:hypothetical protein